MTSGVLHARLFQDTSFAVTHLGERRIERLVGVVLPEDPDVYAFQILLKVDGVPWQKFFLDVGAGFWEQWTDLDPEAYCDDADCRCVDFGKRFGLDGAMLGPIWCEPEFELSASRIVVATSRGRLILRPRIPYSLEPDSEVLFVP